MNNKLAFALSLMVLPIFASCDNGEAEDGGLRMEMTWDISSSDLPSDFIGSGSAAEKIDIKEIKLWIHGVDGSPFVREFSCASTDDLADHDFDLPAGEYRIFTTVNLLPPYVDEYNPTRAFTDGKEHFITLEEPNLSPEPAYCYEDRIVITESGVQTVKVKMKELLAEMTFIIKGVPNGTILKCSVENVTAGIVPKFDETLGEMIAERSEQIVPVDLPVILSTDGIVTIKKFRLLPSVKGATETLIKATLIYPNTKQSEFEIHAPEMRMGGKYHIALDFADMTPTMYLKSVKINDWTEEWTIDGGILNPEN